MLVASEQVISLKMRLLEKRIFENICFTKHKLSQVSFLVCSDFRNSCLWMFFKIVVLKTFPLFTGKHLFVIKLLTRLFKITLLKTRVLSCEYCERLEMFKNSLFIEHHWWLLLWLLSEELQDGIHKFNKCIYMCT